VSATSSADYLLLDMFSDDLAKGVPKMTRGVSTLALNKRRVTFSQLKTVPHPMPDRARHRFTVSVAPGRLAGIRLDGHSVAAELFSRDELFPKRAGTAGSVGVLVHDSTASFHSVRVRPRPIGENP
jgi:hypothetical protein